MYRKLGIVGSEIRKKKVLIASPIFEGWSIDVRSDAQYFFKKRKDPVETKIKIYLSIEIILN